MAKRLRPREDGDMLPRRASSHPAGEPDEPAEVLLAAHERLRHFMTVGLRLPRSPNAPARIIGDTASALRRYFGSTLPQHEQAEDDCVVARLLEVRPGRAVEHALARMAENHRTMDDLLVPLDALWARVIARPSELAVLGEEMHARSRALASLLEGNLLLEEETVFPAIRQWLPEASRRVLLRDVLDRRPSEVRIVRSHR